MNCVEVLERNARKYDSKPAFIFQDSPFSFQELRDSSFRLANSLTALGVKKGDAVAIYLPNRLEYILSYLAVWCLGATAVPLDYMLTEEELAACISHCEARILIAKNKATLQAHALKARLPGLAQVVLCSERVDGCLSFEELVESGKEDPPVFAAAPTDYAIIFYTSGTTGKPKGVLISYKQLDAPAQGMQYFVDITENDFCISSLPYSHLGGLIYLEVLLSFGFTVVLMERFSPHEFLKNVQKYRANWFWLVPSMYYALLQLKEFESYDLSSLRWVVVFGAPSSPEAIRRFQRYCPQAHLVNGWGMTETNAPTVVLPLGSQKIESVGRPAPWIEIQIFNQEDHPVPQGAIGEIVVRSWVVTDGYYKDPELTREAMRNGWFHTGDLGRLDGENHLYIVGRKKEMIKVAGEIVFEPEVEAAIHRHPDVAEAAVIGVPDQLRGEVPKAFVVLKKDVRLEPEELRSFLRPHLAHFKIPHHVEFVAALPKNRVGKIDKEQLRGVAGENAQVRKVV